MTEDKKLICGEHGETDPCMICGHLAKITGKPVGYNPALEPNPDPEWANLREVWCNKCNFWWNMPWPIPHIYNLIAKSPIMVCEGCLKKYKEYHSRPGSRKGWWEENRK